MSPPQFIIRALRAEDYPAVLALWSAADGVEVAEGDGPADLAAYLARNPGLSRVALDGDGGIVAAVLCGHDGRRGLIYHLAVSPAHRRHGLGRRLVEECLTALRATGVRRVLLLVADGNAPARAFWAGAGFVPVEGATVLGRDL